MSFLSPRTRSFTTKARSEIMDELSRIRSRQWHTSAALSDGVPLRATSVLDDGLARNRILLRGLRLRGSEVRDPMTILVHQKFPSPTLAICSLHSFGQPRMVPVVSCSCRSA